MHHGIVCLHRHGGHHLAVQADADALRLNIGVCEKTIKVSPAPTKAMTMSIKGEARHENRVQLSNVDHWRVGQWRPDAENAPLQLRRRGCDLRHQHSIGEAEEHGPSAAFDQPGNQREQIGLTRDPTKQSHCAT